LIADSELSNGCLEDVLLLFTLCLCFGISFFVDIDVASFFFRNAYPPTNGAPDVDAMTEQDIRSSDLEYIRDVVCC